MRAQQPMTLRIPFGWLRYSQPVGYLLAHEFRCNSSKAFLWTERFAFRNDEGKFVKELLQRKKNIWIFRTNQTQFCGDFVLIDMSSPHPNQRPIFVVDLKHGAPLKFGGGGAGIQFRNAQNAVDFIAHRTGIIPSHASYELICGDRQKLLHYLGLPSF